MTTEHRKAPRKKIISVTRVGEWGNVRYDHLLSCGHIESRPREADTKTNTLACAWCFKSVNMGRELMKLGSSTVLYEEDSSSSESRINSIKASIAAKFNVPLDSVDVVSTVDNAELKIQYATVFLSSIDVGRITNT
jgi:hypothetical protein